MKFKKYFTLLLLIPLSAFSPMHKNYISLCEIEYVKEKEAVQIKLALFVDDFEKTLNKNHNTKLFLGTDYEAENTTVYFKEYLNKHFKILINNKLQKLEYLRKEYDNNIVRFYLKINNVKDLNTLEVFNNSLFLDFEDQQNIIKIKVNKIYETFYLDKKKAYCSLNF